MPTAASSRSSKGHADGCVSGLSRNSVCTDLRREYAASRSRLAHREIGCARPLTIPAPLLANSERRPPLAQNACASSLHRERMDGRGAAESLRQFPAARCARRARTRPPRGIPSSRSRTDLRSHDCTDERQYRCTDGDRQLHRQAPVRSHDPRSCPRKVSTCRFNAVRGCRRVVAGAWSSRSRARHSCPQDPERARRRRPSRYTAPLPGSPRAR
jgi:hypothetical protein